jgi:hypothetical protein
MADVVSELIRFSLAIWVGGSVVAAMAAPVVFRTVASRDQAGAAFGDGGVEGEVVRVFPEVGLGAVHGVEF